MRAVKNLVTNFVALALCVAIPAFEARAQSVPASTAMPQGGRVSAGSATILQGGTVANPVLSITQSTDRAVINWQSFNLGRDASVQFQQPSASSVTLNRVISSDPSSIFGKISSNGQIYLINPNGIYFGPTASADVGGLVVTTHGMRDDDFMSGSTTFTRDGATGKVVNEGVLRARMGGYIALLAPEVRNAGIIVAKSGTVALASGDAVTLNVDANNNLTNMLVKPSTMQALVDNQKIIKAPDGQVIVSAQAYNEIAAGVINNSGEISAKGISKSGGAIVLGASTAVNQTGKLNVSSKAGNGGTVKIDAKTVTQSGSIKAGSIAANGKGGLVMLTGDILTLKAGSTISADGTHGGGTVLVGGDWQGSNGVRQAQSVVMEQGASITANATQTGDGGQVVLWSDVTNKNGFTKFDGTIEAKGFSGSNGGHVETSGHALDLAGSVTTGQGGQWLLDPADITIGFSVGSTTNTGGYFQPVSGVSTGYITASSINAALNSGDVVITTTNNGTAGAGTGSITLSAGYPLSGSAGSLSLIASGSILLNSNITLSGAGKALLIKTIKDINIANGTSFQTNNGDMIFWSNSSAGNATNGIAIFTSNASGTNSFNTANGATGQMSGGGRLVFAGGLDDGSNGGIPNDGIPDGFAYTTVTATPGILIGAKTAVTNSVVMNSGGGDVIMRGQSTGYSGIVQYGGLSLKSGNGTISMTGVTSASMDGIDIGYNSNSPINLISYAPANAITLSGTSTSVASQAGISFGFNANTGQLPTSTTIALQSLGGGGISLTGRGSATGYGVTLSDVSFLASSGTISIDAGTRGFSFQNSVAANTHQVTFGSCATCDATSITTLGLYTGASTANVLLKGDSASFYSSSVNLIDVNGSVSIQPYSLNFTNNSFDASLLSYSSNVTAVTQGYLGATANITLANAGTMTLNGGSLTIYGGSITQTAGVTTGGDITYNASSTITLSKPLTSNSGNINLTAAGNLSSTNNIISTNGAITLQGLALTTKTITSKNALTMTATGTTAATGIITLQGNIESTTSAVTLSAIGNITPSGTPTPTLKAGTNVSVISSTSSASPGSVTAGGSITLSGGWIITSALTATNGSISLTSSTTTALTTGALSAGTTITESAAGAIALNGNVLAGGDINLSSASGGMAHSTYTITSTSGNIIANMSGSTGNYTGSGAITASAGTVSITTVAGLSRGNTAGNIAGANGVTLQSTTGGITDYYPINSSAGSVTISAGTSIIFYNSTSTITANNNVSLASLSGTTQLAALITTTTGNVTITSGGGTNGISSIGAINSAGTITLTAPGAINLSSLNLISGGDINVNSTAAGLFIGGTIAKTNGTNDATLNLYAATNISSGALIYAGSSTGNSSANGQLNVMFNPGRATASASGGSLTLTGTIRTQGGYIKGFGGTDQSDYILGSVSGAYGNPGITMGGSVAFAAYSNGGDIKLYAKSAATASSNTNGAIYLQGGITLDSGAGSLMLNAVGQANFSGIYNYCLSCVGNITFTSSSGDISLIGSTSATGSSGISLQTVSGKPTTLTSASGNIYINGENTILTTSAVAISPVFMGSTVSVNAMSGSVIVQGKAANGYLSYTSATTGAALDSSATITAGTRILLESDADIKLGSNKYTAPDIVIVTRTTSNGLGANTLVPGTGRVLLYVSTASNYAPSSSNPIGAGTTFTHYGSTCSFPGTMSCLENPAVVLPTIAGTVLVAANAGSPSFNLYNGKTSPLVGTLNNTNLVFGAQPFQQTLTSSSSATITYISSNTSVATVNASGVVTIVGAGSSTITAAQAGNIYYNSSLVNYAVTVTPAPLTIAANGRVKTYDATAFSGGNGVTFSGFVNNQSASVLGGAIAYGGSSQGATNVGIYSIIPSGYTSTNYAISYTSSLLTINRAPLTAPSMTVASRAYDNSLSVIPTVGPLSGLFGLQTLTVTATGVIDLADAGTRNATVTYTLANGTNGGLASNYILSSETKPVVITPRPITVATSVTGHVYDGTTNIASTLGAASNLIGGQSLNISAVAVSRTPNAGMNTADVTYTLADGIGGLASNYSITPLSLPVTIQPRLLTISGTNVSDRSYDGSRSVAVTPGTQIGNLVGNETVQVFATGTITGKDVGTYTATAVYTLSDGSNGGMASNYTLPSTTHAGVTITPKALSVTGTTVTDRAYDATTNVSATLGAVTGLVGTETLMIVPTAVAASADAGTQSATVSYTLSNGSNGGLASNYSLAATNHSVTISKADLILTGNRPYDQTSIVNGSVLTATGLNGDTFYVTGTGAGTNLNSVNAGTFPLASLDNLALGNSRGLGNPANYQLSLTSSVITITKIPIAVVGDTSGAVNKTYDGTTSLPLSGPQAYGMSGLMAGDSVSLSGAAVFDNPNASDALTPRLIKQGSLVLTGASAGNYFLSWTDGQGAINPAPLTVKANNSAGFTANPSNASFTVSYQGFVNGETETTANIHTTVNLGANLSLNPEKYELIPQMAFSLNYTAIPINGLYTVVAPSKILIAVDNATKTYGNSAPSFSSSNVSYIAPDPNDNTKSIVMSVIPIVKQAAINLYEFTNIAGGKNTFFISSDTTQQSKIGNYPITVLAENTNLADPSKLEVQNGVLTITPRPITVSANGVSKVYDGSTAATNFNVAAQGLINNDNVTASAIAGLYTDKNAGNSKSYTLTGISLGGADAANYYLSAGANLTGSNGTIMPKSVSVSGITAANKIYDGTTTATVAVNGAIINGLVAGDTVNVAATGVFDTANAGTGKTVNLSSSYSGADAGNYSFVSQATATASVTPKALTMTGTMVSDKVYDSTFTAQATQGVLTGFVVGEQVTSTIASANFVDKNVGNQTATVTYQLANGSNGLAANYSVADTTLTAAITPKNVSIAGLTITARKIYDSTTTAAITGAATLLSQSTGSGNNADGKIYTVDPLVTLTGTAAATYDSKDVLTASTISISGLSLSGAGSSNYTLLPLSQSGTITPKNLTMSGLTLVSPSKTYDGSTTATLQNATGTLQSSIAVGTGTSGDGMPYTGDTVTLSGTAAANYITKNVGAGITIVFSGIGLSGSEAGNYTLIQQSPLSNGAITPKSLTVANTTVANKIYDTTTVATLSNGSLVGLIAGDASGVVLTQAGTFVDANAGAGKSVNAADSISGASAGNYTLIQPTGLTATISQKAVTINNMQAADKIYDGTTAGTLSGGSLSGIFGSDQAQVSLSQNGVFISATVGSNIGITSTSSLSGAQSGNYSLVQPTGITASITTKDLTVSGASVVTKTYDATTAASLSGGALVGLVPNDTSTTLITPVGSFLDANVGSNKPVSSAFTLSGVLASNYRLIQPRGLTGTIDKATLTVTPTAGLSKTYGGFDPTFTYNLAGYVGGETTAAGLSGLVTRAAGENVSTYAYSVSQLSATNYQFALAGGAPTFAITPATLIVKANTDAKFVTQSDAVNFNGVSYNGFVNGETSSVLSGVLAVARTNAAQNNAGTYAGVLQPAGLSSNNYTIQYQTGDYVIVPAGQLLIRAANTTTTYGTNPTLNTLTVKYMQDNNGTADLMTLTPTIGNPALYTDGVGGTVTFNLAALGPQSTSGFLNVGQYAITATNIVKQGNNFLNTPVVIGTLSVTQKFLTPQAAPSKTYDGTTALPTANLTLSGLIAGDQVVSTSNGVYQSRNAGNSKGYNIYDVAVSGSDSANYYLTTTAFTATNGVILPKAVTLAPQAVSKTYDGSTHFAATNSDLAALTTQLGIAGDIVTGVTLTYDTKNAGTNKSLTASNAIISDGNSGLNYAISYQNNTASEITRAALTVVGSTVTTKAYDGAVAAAITGGTLVGIVGADQVTLNQSGLFASANAANSITVNATDTLSGLAANNYALIQPTGLTGTIIPKTVSVSGTVVADKIYSGTTDATISTLGSIQGLVGTETLGLNGVATFGTANAGINKSVGLDYTLSNGSGLASNYTLPAASTSATINHASLVVTANHDTRLIAQGDAFNYNGVNYTGFVNGETSAVLGGTLSVARSNPTQNAAATYHDVLVPSGLTSSNYAITYQNGNYTIVPAEQVLVRMSNVVQNYGTSLILAPLSVQYVSNGSVLTTLTQASASNNTYTYNDGFGGSLSFTLTPANPVTSTSGNLVVGNYTVTGSGISAGGSNFTGTPVFSGGISILKSALTPSTSQVSKTYDGSASMGTVSVQFAGVVTQAGTTDLVTSTGSGLYATKNAGSNIAYTVTGLAPTGADAGNYYIAGGTTFTGNNGIITPKAVQLVAGTSQKIYDGTISIAATAADLSALSAQLGVAGDTVNAVTLQYANRNAGLGKVLTPSGAVISDGQSGGNYQITYASSNTSVISPKEVTLTPQTASKTYDASTSYSANASDLAYLTSQLGVTGDTVTGVTLLTPDKIIGTKTLAASSALVNDGNNGLNYTLSYGSSTIAVAAKTISTLNTTVVTKTYDKNTAATLTGAMLNGVEFGDTVSLTQTGLFATNQAGSTIAVSAIESISGADAGNYILSPTLGLTGTITPRLLSVTYGGINKVYDTSTLAQVTTSDNRIAGDNLIINRDAAFASANVGSNLNVQLSGVYLSGGDAGNYSVSATGTTTASITQRPVLVTGSTENTKVYDGNTNATLSNGVVVGFLGTDTATLNQVGSFATKNAGSAIAVTANDTLSGASAGNYIIEQPIGLTGVITPKALSVSGSTVTDRIYDGTTTLDSTAGTLSGFIGTETVTASSVATASSKNVGTQTATLVYTLANGSNGGLAGNYSLANTGLSVSIAIKDLTVVGTKIETKIFYGKTDAKASGGILVGVVGGDQITLIENATFVSSNVGLSVPVIMNDQILGAYVGNYRLLQPQGLTGTINANTPILYPSVSTASVSNPSPTPVTGGASAGWTVEASASPAQGGQAGAAVSTAASPTGSSVAIKVVAEAPSALSGADFLNVGRVVTLDGGVSNPTITSASISFVKGFEPGRTLLELTQLGPVQVKIDNASGKIVLTGAASASDYNRIIQSVRMKLNGASQQRVIAMNVGLVDMTGKRDTRMITLKPNDLSANAEIKVPAPAQSQNGQTSKPLREQQGRIILPALPAASFQLPTSISGKQMTERVITTQ